MQRETLLAKVHLQIYYIEPIWLQESETDLPVCGPKAVCSKVDLYESPWLERQCRCPDGRICPSGMAMDDGYTLADKTRQYKLCEPVKKLPKCRWVIS